MGCWVQYGHRSFPRPLMQKVAEFGGDTPMMRPGQPEELGPAYVFSDCGRVQVYVIELGFAHINGGEIVNS